MEENPYEPHKDADVWHFLTRFPPTYLSAPRFIAMFRRRVDEAVEARPGFNDRLRQASLYVLDGDDWKLVRQALQCLAITGKRDELPTINALANHPDSDVARDARTCAFEIAKRDCRDLKRH
jgi:hypothetical protein